MREREFSNPCLFSSFDSSKRVSGGRPVDFSFRAELWSNLADSGYLREKFLFSWFYARVGTLVNIVMGKFQNGT